MRTNSFGRNSGRGLGQWMMTAEQSWFSGTLLPNSILYDIAIDGNGCVYVSARGSSNGGTPTTYKQYVFKLDADGSVVWQKELSVKNTGSLAGFSSQLAVNASSSLVAVISPTYETGTSSHLESVVSVLDASDGALQWQRQISSGSAQQVSGHDICFDDSDNVFATGTAAVFGTGTVSFLIKYNSSGTLQWQNNNYASTFAFYGCATDSSGNVYVSGNGSSAGSHICKFDSGGTLQWDKHYTGQSFTKLAVSSSGNQYVLSGSYLGKFSDAGSLQWAKSLGHGGKDVKLNADENVFVYSSITDYSYLSVLDSSGNGVYEGTLAVTSGTSQGATWALGVSSEGHVALGTNTSGIFAMRTTDDGSSTGSGNDSYRGVSYSVATYSPSSTTWTAGSTALSAKADITSSTCSFTASTPTETFTTVTF